MQFDEYSESYTATVNRSLGRLPVKVEYATQVKTGYLRDLMDRRLGASGALAVLDVGCGVGNAHPMLLPHVGSLTGVDVSRACIEQAAQQNPDATYHAYEGGRLPLADDCFDVAYATCVMHHVPPADWPAFAAELRRVVRPGGMAVIFEHNPLNPLTRRIVSNCEFDADAVLLRQHEVRRLLAGAGFAAIESNTILTLPSWNGWTRRVDAVLGRLSLGAQYYAAGTA